jgi:DNA repair photolyase
MPLKKVTAGSNMYQDWISHTHTHLAGECPHKCKYCYAQKGVARISGRYKGEPRLVESELDVNYGILKTIFIEHMSDLFAVGIKDEWIEDILNHCRHYPRNKYVFQTKNVLRLYSYYAVHKFPDKTILVGTTIETNRNTFNFNVGSQYDISNTPLPFERYRDIKNLGKIFCPVFVTIEPIIDFDVDVLSNWIVDIQPNFVNIGADSKGCNLPEPSKEKILKFVDILRENNITIKRKTNLERLLR